MPQLRNLRRATDKKVIAGVCAGIAGWAGWDVTIVRVLFVVGSFVPIIPGFIVYVILWLVVPAKDEPQ